MNIPEIDDKDIAMVIIGLLCGVGMFVIDDPNAALSAGIAALGALATGRKKG